MSVTHLQVQSCYSLMQSTVTIDELIEKVNALGMEQVALTDHNVLNGAIEFYQKASRAGIKPIIGMTLDIQSLYRPDSTLSIVLLAKNKAGYKALIDLSTTYQLSHEPISKEKLQQTSADLIAIVPSYEDEVRTFVKNQSLTELQGLLSLVQESYLGVTPNQSSEMIEALKQTDLPLIAIGDVRTVEEKDANTLEILEHISTNQPYQVDTNARVNHAIRSTEEMTQFYEQHGIQEALANNQQVADVCHFELELGHTQLPKFKVPDNYTTDSYLRELCLEGLNELVPDYSPDYEARLDKELSVISEMGFSDYFLIVWDVMHFAHQQNIETGFGRGSAAASLVAYTLKITAVDPLKYDLLFERFLNKERFTMPDIDLDFPDNKRHRVLEYVLETYGADHVAQILTFGTFAAKSSVREILRVTGADSDEMKRWSKAIPNQPKITLEEAYNESKALQSIVGQSYENRRLFDMAKVIEGLPRNYSTHAAGVVMAHEPLTENVPLQEGIADIHNTQFTMGDVEAVGLLKMDFLSLKNLTVMTNCFYYSQYEQNGPITKADVAINDPQTLDLFARGDTNGVFQFEKEGIKNVLRCMQPSSIEDIIATNALYRPGPMKQIETYINRKHGKEAIQYPHDDLEDILKITYGIMVYQEQVMQVATTLAGYSLSEADQLRRTMSKKIKAEMEAGQAKFIEGALANGYTEETAKQIYSYIENFADYGFNRAHAVVYSMLAYHLAYFKTHFPKSFFASVLRADWANKAKIKVYGSEIRQRGIQLIAPNINTSLYTFSVNQKGIQFGLNMVKGLNDNFVRNIIEERQSSGPFESLMDFCERIDDRFLRQDMIEPLIKAGAFDSIGYNRHSLIASLESTIESVEKSGGNISLFEVIKPRETRLDEYQAEQLVAMEQEMTGFYFSGHPMHKYNGLKQTHSAQAISQVAYGNQTVLGKVTSLRKIMTKNNQPMAFVTLIDESGELPLVIFPDQYAHYLKLLKQDAVLIVRGKVEDNKNQKQMIVNELIDADEVLSQKQKLFLKFDDIEKQSDDFMQIRQLLANEAGTIPVIIYDEKNRKYTPLKAEYNFNNNTETLKKVKQILGYKNCVLQ